MGNPKPSQDRLMSVTTWATLLILGSVVLLAAWLRLGVIGSDRWAIEWLEVSGHLQRTSASQVRAAAAPHASAGFFATDLGAVREAVEALPWVSQARVTRIWPDTVAISLEEHQPLARWNSTGVLSGLETQGGALLSIDGSEDIQGLVRLYGPEGRHEEVLAVWQTMRSDLSAVGLHVDSLKLDERGSWTVMLSNGTELRLGRERRDERLARFIAVHEHIRMHPQQARMVDMRYANGMAVEWATSTRERDTRG